MKNKIVSLLFLFLAIALIIVGINRNEVKTVYKKSSNICMECIGIG